MSEKDKLQQALDALLQGNKPDAEQQLWSLEPKISEKKQRVQLIDGLLSASNPIDGGEKLLKLSTEAIGISKEIGNKKLVSHFMLRRVNLLMGTLIFPQHEQANLKLSPDWLEFSTELDKAKFDECSNAIIQTENEMNDLLSQVIEIAKSEKDTSIIANVYLIQGNIISSKLLRQKSEYMRGSIGVKLWVRFYIFRYPFFNFLTIPKFEQRRQIRKMTKDFIKYISHAASIFEKLDDVTAGYAFYTLANDLNTIYKFRTARKFLTKAESIAKKHNDTLLTKQVDLLRKILNNKGRNVPNYAEGEKREINTSARYEK